MGEGQKAYALCPSSLCRPTGKNKGFRPGPGWRLCYCPARSFLLNGVNPAATCSRCLVRGSRQVALDTLPG